MTAPAAPTASMWEDFLEIFYQPSAVFERRRQNPGFWGPLIVLLVVMLVLTFATKSAMEPIFDAEFKRGMAAAVKSNPKLTPEMVESSKGMSKKFLPVLIGGYFFFAPLILGFCVWLVGKIFEAKEELTAAIMVTTYAMYPRIIEAILGALQALLLPDEKLNGRFSVSLGVGRFLNPDTANPLALAILGRVDVFTIWVTVLLAIGLSVTGRIPRSRAAIAAALIWVIGALPSIPGALRAM
ncbi:MAG: YIP1 family protein [Gemmatimonadota bacterium]